MDTNMTKPMISVVMPVYNAEKYVAEAIDSILNQTYNDFEFIIIDDCSTDNSFEILRDYSHKDSRIKLFRNEVNLKLPKTLNFAILQSSGKYIARMDADDISKENRLKQQLTFMESYQYVGVSGTWFAEFSNNINDSICHKLPTLHNEIELQLKYFGNCIAHPTVMIRSDLFKTDNFYNDKSKVIISEDYELWDRMLTNKVKFANIDEFLLFYRRNSMQSTSKYVLEFRNTRRDILLAHYLETFGKYFSANLLNEFVNYLVTPKSELTILQLIRHFYLLCSIVSCNKRYAILDNKAFQYMLKGESFWGLVSRVIKSKLVRKL